MLQLAICRVGKNRSSIHVYCYGFIRKRGYKFLILLCIYISCLNMYIFSIFSLAVVSSNNTHKFQLNYLLQKRISALFVLPQDFPKFLFFWYFSICCSQSALHDFVVSYFCGIYSWIFLKESVIYFDLRIFEGSYQFSRFQNFVKVKWILMHDEYW